MAKDAVMISIRPEWCKLIAEGKKTVEVRKNAPLFATFPFKCYIYESRERKAVIGEFVCDCIQVIEEPYWAAGTRLTAHQMHEYAQGALLYGWHISDLVIYDQPRSISEFFVKRNATHDCPSLVPLKRPPQSWCYVYGLEGNVVGKSYGDCNYCKNRNLSAHSDTCKYCGLTRKNFEWISYDEYADRAALDDIDDGGENDENA